MLLGKGSFGHAHCVGDTTLDRWGNMRNSPVNQLKGNCQCAVERVGVTHDRRGKLKTKHAL